MPQFKLEDDEYVKEEDEVLFGSAENDFTNGNYLNAKLQYLRLIDLFPESKFAVSSMKQLFAIEGYLAGNYQSLKQYLMTNDTILGHPQLKLNAAFFVTQCDLKLGNWDEAINWFENRIQNPASVSDSINALIDLENTYFLKQQQLGESAMVEIQNNGKILTKKQLMKKRRELLSLLKSKKQ
jgi:hypothetical protein